MRLILTIAVGPAFQEIAALTHPLIGAYARQVGADFVSINTATSLPHLEKFRMADFLGRYDRVLFIDTDIVITGNCPDLFSIVPDGAFGAWFPDPMIPGRFAGNIARVQEVLGDIGWVDGYFNSGVMVASRCHRPVFQDPEDYTDSFFEQTLLNYRVRKRGHRTLDIGYRWNHTGIICSEKRFESHFIHYAGSGHRPGLSRVEQIRADLRALGRL